MLTPDEIIAFAKADRETCRVVSAAGITIDPEPSAPPSRPGYNWIPKQISAGGAIWRRFMIAGRMQNDDYTNSVLAHLSGLFSRHD